MTNLLLAFLCGLGIGLGFAMVMAKIAFTAGAVSLDQHYREAMGMPQREEEQP